MQKILVFTVVLCSAWKLFFLFMSWFGINNTDFKQILITRINFSSDFGKNLRSESTKELICIYCESTSLFLVSFM